MTFATLYYKVYKCEHGSKETTNVDLWELQTQSKDDLKVKKQTKTSYNTDTVWQSKQMTFNL